MSTVSREFARNIMKNNGWYNGDSDNTLGDNPRCVKIVQYTNAWGGEAYGLILEGQDPNKYHPSEYVINPVTYWEAKDVK